MFYNDSPHFVNIFPITWANNRIDMCISIQLQIWVPFPVMKCLDYTMYFSLLPVAIFQLICFRRFFFFLCPCLYSLECINLGEFYLLISLSPRCHQEHRRSISVTFSDLVKCSKGGARVLLHMQPWSMVPQYIYERVKGKGELRKNGLFISFKKWWQWSIKEVDWLLCESIIS